MMNTENTAPFPNGNDNVSDDEDNIFITGKKKSTRNRLQDSDDEDNITNRTILSSDHEKRNGNDFINSDDESANSITESGKKDTEPDRPPVEQGDSNTSDEEISIFVTRKKKSNVTITEDTDGEKSVSQRNDTRDHEHASRSENILRSDEDSVGSTSKTTNKSSLKKRSIIRPENDDSESDSSDDADICKSGRIQDRRNKLTDKFKSMLGKKKLSTDNDGNKQRDGTVVAHNVKPKSTIDNLYDSEESDYDAEAGDQADNEILNKKRNKHVKSSPKKVQRMSAKQAMENMHVINSESNRMLREKQISLPYHRPRQITLKEIMGKRLPILGPGGKQLRVKMNEEQLREYALQLEERHKQVIELYKSESEDEIDKEDDENSAVKELNAKPEESEEKSPTAEGETKINDNPINESVVLEIMNSETEDLISINFELGINSENKVDCCDENRTDIPGKVEELTIRTIENHIVLESQQINLNYNSELTEQVLDKDMREDSKGGDAQNEADENLLNQDKADIGDSEVDCGGEPKKLTDVAMEDDFDDHFSDVDMSHVEEVIRRIEDNDYDHNKENENDQLSNPAIFSENLKPKLSGAPGTIIDLDSDDPKPCPRKLSGLDRLKEQFMYFSTIKTSDEYDKQKEKNIIPGAQHLKLKQELEEQMAVDRAEEWAKRFEEERTRQEEMKQINGEVSETEDILDEIEKEEVNELEEDDSSGGEEDESELEENDVDMSEKPKKKNPLLDGEAEEVDEEEEVEAGEDYLVYEDEDESEGSESEEEIEDNSSKNEGQKKPSRIIKAFVDSSDDENESDERNEAVAENGLQTLSENERVRKSVLSDDMFATQEYKDNTEFDNEEEIPLAQQNTSITENTQNSSASEAENVTQECAPQADNLLCSGNAETPDVCAILRMDSGGQPDMDDIIGLCSGKFTSQTESQDKPANNDAYVNYLVMNGTATQCIDEDVLALCTGKFVDGIIANDASGDEIKQTPAAQEIVQAKPSLKDSIQDTSLRELLGLDEEQESGLTRNRYFPGPEVKGHPTDVASGQNNGKLVILSSDDECEEKKSTSKQKKLKSKRDRLKRTIQMSDDDDSDGAKSEVETEDTEFRVVEYDSEENEIVVPRPEATKLQKRQKLKAAAFFENEAELTSEDEWLGSGDEDEKGLDELEWEEGDADKFDQKKVQRELERIHLNQMMDKDKREVRLLQEILLDEDEPGGTRQRKFKWKNADWGPEQEGTVPEEGAEADDEGETEEQWRRQRHERDVFLRQMMEKKTEENVLDVSFSRTTIIKANLESKTMSSMLLEVKAAKLNTSTEEWQSVTVDKKMTSNDLPSPVKKPFGLIQHSIRGSFLSRGKSSLERLAALAKPIAGAKDEEAQPANLNLLAPGKKRSFVFATVSPPCPSREMEEESKLAKRKANAEASTPHLIKKMRIADGGKSRFKKSLLDHIDQ